jgi:CRP-like cAMP-binding protein
MTIEKAGSRASSPSGTFIGEIAFLLSRPATATVTLEPGIPYFVWNGGKLRQLMQKQPALGTALSAVLNKKLAQKVAAAGVLMNTIGIEAPTAAARCVIVDTHQRIWPVRCNISLDNYWVLLPQSGCRSE